MRFRWNLFGTTTDGVEKWPKKASPPPKIKIG